MLAAKGARCFLPRRGVWPRRDSRNDSVWEMQIDGLRDAVYAGISEIVLTTQRRLPRTCSLAEVGLTAVVREADQFVFSAHLGQQDPNRTPLLLRVLG